MILSAKDAGDVIRNVINHDGIIEAQTVVKRDGRIILSGGDKGVVSVAGSWMRRDKMKVNRVA